ncbi:MAG: AbrB/MazE/SpoVT family DNA-binding domain-containing protein [Thermoanaerobaculia bacterium]
MARYPDFHHIRLGRQGRLVLPAEVRQRLGLEDGQVLLLQEEEGRIVLETRAGALMRLREPFASIPAEVSLADELIAERRREAAAESREEEGSDAGG